MGSINSVDALVATKHSRKATGGRFGHQFSNLQNQFNMDPAIDRFKALEFLLKEKYFSEFEVIDRRGQHPEGINFYEWLFRKKLITKEENQRIQIAIQQEESED